MAKYKPTNKQASYLRGLGHHLSPLAMIGREGITENVAASVDQVIQAHELIKIKVQNNCPLDKKTAAAELGRRLNAVVIQLIGHIILLYRENPDRAADKKIILP